jgi:hypothetical protein
MAIVFLNPEDLGLSIPRKCRRIQNDEIESSSSSLETSQPIENISINKIVVLEADPIDFVISFSPIEIVARQIEVYGSCSANGGCHPKGAGVRKGIQDRLMVRQISQLVSIGPLIEKKPGGVSCLKIDLKPQPGFKYLERIFH